MLALGPRAVLALSPGIVLQALPDQGWFFAFNVETGDHYSLNKTSFWILESLGEGIEWVDLKERFLGAFAVSSEEGEADLKAIVNQFFEEKLIRRLES